MPFLGLIFTSLGFAVPALKALRHGKLAFAGFCGLLCVTSTLYHATVHPVFEKIDKLYAHSFATIYILKGILDCIATRSPVHFLLLTSTSLPLGLFFEKSLKTEGMESKMWHMLFHISAQGCMVGHAVHGLP